MDHGWKSSLCHYQQVKTFLVMTDRSQRCEDLEPLSIECKDSSALEMVSGYELALVAAVSHRGDAIGI